MRMIPHLTLTLVALMGVGTTPAECVAVARKDAETIPQSVLPYIRYFSLGEFDMAEREAKIRVLSGHVNHLSVEQDLVPVHIVDEWGLSVVRINLNDYHWSVETWDRLARVDPYFHVKVIREWEGGVWPADGKTYAKGAFPYNDFLLAPVLSEGPEGKANLSYLADALKTRVPILRADWFLNQTAIQANRAVGYFDWLGIKDQKTFDDLAGFDPKIGKRSGRIDRESVALSGVSLQPRGILRKEGVRPIWVTFDFEQALGQKNPLRVIGSDIEDSFDATEQFGLLRNGLWATFLANGKGVRQDFAPPQIASDSMSRSNDKRVHINISCIRCHADGGLQSIDGHFRNAIQPPLNLGATDEGQAREFRQQYMSDLKRYLNRDRRVYEEAVKEVTGWTAKEWSTRYAAEWERYEDARVDLAWVARDLHVPQNQLKDAMNRALQQKLVIRYQDHQKIEVAPAIDLVFGTLIRGGSIGIRQYEELFPSAYATLRGVVP